MCTKRVLSTLSLRRATFTLPVFGICADISIHALLAESDDHPEQSGAAPIHFYPRSPCGERPRQTSRLLQGSAISIHALLAESDIFRSISATVRPYFYPRSPCGERPFSLLAGLLVALYFYPRSPCGERRGLISLYSICSKFLSTLSLRRATAIGRRGRAARDNFYPRSPCGERRGRRRRPGPRENYFYPRSPCGERPSKRATPARHPYFYPRSPCGERQYKNKIIIINELFLSTLSLRRATPTAMLLTFLVL